MQEPVKSYAAFAADRELGPFSLTRRDPRPDDVVIDILYCGVCHSDLHWAHNDWGFTSYPVVPGHEIIGRVRDVGQDVTRFQPGDMVGVGCFVDSCGKCGPCQAGAEPYCGAYPTPTYGAPDRRDGQMTHGGYSERIVVTEKFVLRVPDGLDPSKAAPLLCAGITTYSPFIHWGIGAQHKIAVVGLGGLGHMALKFGRALGADVTLFTTSPNKKDEALRLGANNVVVSTDAAQMAEAASQFDFILDTVPTQHDLNPYLQCLAFNGTLILLGLIGPIEPPVNSMLLMSRRASIAGSAVGGLHETQQMLDFCAAKSIDCDVETIRLEDINAAFVRLEKADVRYRFVIDMATA